MNKLKNKVFLTIFIILSIFGLSILIIYNYQNYTNEENRIVNQLRNELKNPSRLRNSENIMRFFDAKVYKILYSNGEIIQITSYAQDDELNDEIYNIANNLLDKENGIYIGNLYFNNYSYKITKNSITIVDNSDTNNKLLLTLRISLIVFLLIEVISYLISYLLSSWIIKPVEEAFDKQKQFIADASHELKTPLAVIMASADTLEKDNNKKWIKNIQTESDRMNKLIKNLLDLSKVENSNPIKENINLSKLIEKSILPLESLMYEKNIKFEYKIEDNINFECNSEEIKQLMNIILDNAIKNKKKNGNIFVNLNKEKNDIIIKIKNKGNPIPEGEEEKIFERFYRSDKSRNRNDNRYGLGLAIAKSIVIKHNGIIKAESKNKYTTFTINFKKK